jgi:hypothetical protein
MHTLRVDFNDIDRFGRLGALVRFASGGTLTEGARAYLKDGEGNRCWGRVSTIHGPLAYVDPDWSTWTTAHREPQAWWVHEQPDSEWGITSGFIATKVRIESPANTPVPAKTTGDEPIRYGRLPPLVPS